MTVLVNYLYFAFVAVAMCGSYLVLRELFPFFFEQKRTPLDKKSLYPLVLILICFWVIYAISTSIHDLQLGNRIQHAFAGGFMAFFVCFLAARDSGVRINKFQFLLFSALIVVTLGVGNELAEFALQEYAGIIFAPTTIDTWLDLTSNTVGIILAAICFVPFHKKS